MNKWDKRFMDMAYTIAAWSKDPRTNVGAVLVSPDRRAIIPGYNGFPSGIDDSEDRLTDRGTKNTLMLHAEHNAILNATHVVIDPGWTLYCTKAPCTACALVIIQSRIGRVISPWMPLSDPWFDDQWEASILLLNAKIEVKYV